MDLPKTLRERAARIAHEPQESAAYHRVHNFFRLKLGAFEFSDYGVSQQRPPLEVPERRVLFESA